MTSSLLPDGLPEQAVLLCGGLGSRLGELTRSTPKPLLPVNGRPFIEILIEEIARQGVKRFLLLAAFCSDQVIDFAAGLPAKLGMDISVEIAIEPDRAGTGGALWYARDRLDERFYLLNGDSWFDVVLSDLAELLRQSPDAVGALSLRPLPSAGRYGTVAMDGDHVRSFRAAGESDESPALVNGGVYLFKRDVVDALLADCSLEQDVMPRLARDGRLMAMPREGFFIDIGIPADYERAQTDIANARRRPAVFLDRDGVLNIDHGHVGTPERFEWVEGAIEAIRRANRSGAYVFVVTNQAGIAKGKYSEADYHRLRDHIRGELGRHGAHIDDERYCPYHPDGTVERYRQVSAWRKPAPGMLQDLIARWPVDIGRSFLIGDNDTDIEAAEAAGIHGYKFSGGRLDELVRELIDHHVGA